MNQNRFCAKLGTFRYIFQSFLNRVNFLSGFLGNLYNFEMWLSNLPNTFKRPDKSNVGKDLEIIVKFHGYLKSILKLH